MKLVTFTDQTGRIIVGEELADKSTISQLVVKNPVICSLVPPQEAGKPMQLSILPYCFIELMDLSKHEDWEVSFGRDRLTMITSVNGGETNNLHAALVNNYTSMFERVRNYKNQPTAPVTVEPQAASAVDANTVEVTE